MDFPIPEPIQRKLQGLRLMTPVLPGSPRERHWGPPEGGTTSAFIQYPPPAPGTETGTRATG